MAESFLIPRMIPLDVQQGQNPIQELTQVAQISETPSVNEGLLTEEAWKDFVALHPHKSLPSFQTLWTWQGNDQKSESLSIRDIQIGLAKRREVQQAEKQFIAQQGAPHAIVRLPQVSPSEKETLPSHSVLQTLLEKLPPESLQLLRMPNGDYYVENAAHPPQFKKLEDAQNPLLGRQIELAVGNVALEAEQRTFLLMQSLQKLQSQLQQSRLPQPGTAFQKTSLPSTQQIKALTAGATPSSLPSRSFNPDPANVYGQIHLEFGGVDYPYDSTKALVIYHPQSPEFPYVRAQGLNACLSAAIVNGLVFAGKFNRQEATRAALKLQEKMVEQQHSPDGRLDMPGGPYPEDGQPDPAPQIPGLKFTRIPSDQVQAFLEAKTPVIATIPYFLSHAYAVTQISPQHQTYQAIDSFAGVMVEEKIPQNPQQATPGEQALHLLQAAGKATDRLLAKSSGPLQVFAGTLLNKVRLATPTSLPAFSGSPPSVHFYKMEITNLADLKKWLGLS